MIASIEQAIRQRLSDGLGQMVTGVFTYGGEFDGEGLAQVVNQFPKTPSATIRAAAVLKRLANSRYWWETVPAAVKQTAVSAACTAMMSVPTA
mgnify:CR=1 FL=1